MLENIIHIGLSIFLLGLAVKYAPAITVLGATFGTVIVTGYSVRILARMVRAVLPRRRVSPSNKAVIITGCDIGLGHDLAKRLDKYGFQVFAGCLDPSGVGPLTLKTSSSPNLHVLKMDVTKEDEIQATLKYVKEQLGTNELWALVNNAGLGTTAELEWQDMNRLRHMFEVNVFGMVRVTQVFLPLLRRSKGRVVNINSMAGRAPNTKIGGYSMSKAASVSFGNVLRVEMMKWGVQVSSIEAWVYRTHIVDDDYQDTLIDTEWGKAPEEVKEDYGKEYLESFRVAMKRFTSLGSRKISQVVGDMEDAVTAMEHRATYSPGLLPVRVAHWLWTLLPRVFTDYFLHVTGPWAVPAALKTTKLKSH